MSEVVSAFPGRVGTATGSTIARRRPGARAGPRPPSLCSVLVLPGPSGSPLPPTAGRRAEHGPYRSPPTKEDPVNTVQLIGT